MHLLGSDLADPNISVPYSSSLYMWCFYRLKSQGYIKEMWVYYSLIQELFWKIFFCCPVGGEFVFIWPCSVFGSQFLILLHFN